MHAAHRQSADSLQEGLRRGTLTPASFRAALLAVPGSARDAWLDDLLGLDGIPDDGPLPRGCAPYLPCSVVTLLDLFDHASVGPDDVFVDLGAGLGRATMLAHLCTGASSVAIELQPELAAQARALAARFHLSRMLVLEGDAAELTAAVTDGTVYFLYCPFGGERLTRVLAQLEAIARARPIRVCCVDMPLPPCSWLAPLASPSPELTIFTSR